MNIAKKLLPVLLAALAMTTMIFADEASITFDENTSTVNVKFNASNYEDYKVIVQKGSVKYTYNLYDNDETFPLQMGSGSYSVGIYKRTAPGSTKYSTVTKKYATVTLKDNVVYLQSVQNINWSDKSKAIELAKQLKLKDAKNPETFQAIYTQIVTTIAYDNKKASNISDRYLPVIDSTLIEKKGICYDYSSLMASMLRSLGIPTKMIHGNTSNVSAYHAWNEVLLDGKWIIIDTTVDAQLTLWGSKFDIQKPASEYENIKEF